ncbi:DNA adenine methylase [Zymomonas mobilis]|uniref:Site-specific DNA-methyltransferase (adenine-specific) n=1 Tax=Zymomonas mobilis subsp. mobilis (strain ATCC 31821 / ZM4 / CP4) TaxID=264203 RepID=A0A806CP81_ZYMMO|nr:Dam family site-specific DNA-(adenine-N6)-methyltransferase [Zymomonas mobilis]ADC33913.1 DNA adenine methylase [Zymomonas mobilis subsp. mobilis ZM4 = ATCC 31821]AHB11145.1 DNA adenine methylase Dam [Zymomonas mobilis subsp. mobilis str. CP4 = NRRL B-14023]AHJ71391.1 Modification methylase DpnIIA [Zymomonas mobilis subsp. mobilis NRRL B-12526]
MAEPFLKWAGGKRWLAHSSQLPCPRSFERYIEPFLGGGAIFFHLTPQKAILSDINPELIELYCVMRDSPTELMDLMKRHHKLHNNTYYYSIRNNTPDTRIERAARMLYLNRTCWNGLYRVNLKGVFNVPIGTKSSVVFEHDDFEAIAKLLQDTDIQCCDFEETISKAKAGDFIFIDPPYTVRHNLNGFIKYNEKLFSWDDQIRLKNSVEKAIERGASVTVTNADHDSIKDLYKEICEYHSIARSSILAGRSDRRTRTTEAIFSANI